MNKQQQYVLRTLYSGLAWPTILEVLEECVKVEERKALSATGEMARDGVMRAQGAQSVLERFAAAAAQAESEQES